VIEQAVRWLTLPTSPRVVFEHTPLALVLCQVRFPTVLNVTNPAAVAPFQEAIRDDFPVAEPYARQVMGFGIQLDPSGFQFPQGAPSVTWRFTDIDDKWTVVLTPEFLTLETRAYVDYDDFHRRLLIVLAALDETIRPTVCTRIGLRYINEIRPGHDRWDEVVRPELLGPISLSAFRDFTKQAAQQIVLDGPTGQRVHLQHGIIPTGTTVQAGGDESPPEAPFYLVDIDVFKEFPRSEYTVMKSPAVASFVDDLRDTASQIFRWSITSAYVDSLGEKTHVVR
jgi:uncharacterized protein (TIGR04255 family)